MPHLSFALEPLSDILPAVRAALEGVAAQAGARFIAPPLRFCTDNAAMIAWAGIERLGTGAPVGADLVARPRWPRSARKVSRCRRWGHCPMPSPHPGPHRPRCKTHRASPKRPALLGRPARDSLDLEEILDAELAALAAEAGLLVAAEGAARRATGTVELDHPAAELS